MVNTLRPIRERRAELAASPGRVCEILHESARRVRGIAQTTMGEIREKLGLTACS